MKNVDTVNFNVYLEELSKHLRVVKKNAILVMDGAGWHKSKNLKIPENIDFIIQPPYSPELNPVEKLWQYIKRHTIKNKVFKTIKDIENELSSFINKISNEKYMTVCKAEYIIDT